jgi:adenylylsulfate kinase
VSAAPVVWITGLPASGKSTLAERLKVRLPGAVVLDGDVLRPLLAGQGYDEADRDLFYEALARLAALISAQGVPVLVAATAHARAHRARARALCPHFVEVHVTTPREACEARDPKGLYRRARAGEVDDLPGVGVAYEPPDAPEVVAEGGHDDAAAARIAALCRPAS